ncbi:hypothetical protein T484DRAFT_1820496 [Baffinella frigidus]|nr:hypothetical protein T484DRAFT_1820496 [Cryptophyta sp. CCMP2293]
MSGGSSMPVEEEEVMVVEDGEGPRSNHDHEEEAVGHGGSPGAGGGAQPVAQPGCGGQGVLGAGAEGQAAERADGAVVAGVGEANFVGAEKVLGQVVAPGLGGGEAPAPQHGSTGEGVSSDIPEGQGAGRADGAAVPHAGSPSSAPQDGTAQAGSLELGRRQRAVSAVPKPPSDPRRVGKAAVEYCMHREVLEKTCTEVIAEHFGCSAKSVRRAACALAEVSGALEDLATGGATERGEFGLPPYLRPFLLPACKEQAHSLPERATPAGKQRKRKRQPAASAADQELRRDVQLRMAAKTLSSGDGRAELEAAHIKISSSALRKQHRKAPGSAPAPRGHPTVLPLEQELRMVKWAQSFRAYRVQITRSLFLGMVERWTRGTALAGAFKNGRPSDEWYRGFLNRHRNVLGERCVSALETDRHKWCTAAQMKVWFDWVVEVLLKNGMARENPSYDAAFEVVEKLNEADPRGQRNRQAQNPRTLGAVLGDAGSTARGDPNSISSFGCTRNPSSTVHLAHEAPGGEYAQANFNAPLASSWKEEQQDPAKGSGRK